MAIETFQGDNAYELKRRKCARMLIWACFIMYIFAMGTKNIFTAEIVVLQEVFETTKAQTSLAMTYYFIPYAVVQVLLSIFMPRIRLSVYLAITLATSAVITIVLGVAPSIETAYVLCAANGVMQAGAYSGCMALISKYVPGDMLNGANRIMTMASVAYGVISYGMPALFVGHGLWNVPFFLAGGLFLLSVLFFFYSINKMRTFGTALFDGGNSSGKPIKKEREFITLSSTKQKAYYLAIMFLITFFANVMHYAVLNWIPDLLFEVFGMPREYSILITLIVTVVSAIFSLTSIAICEKKDNLMNVAMSFLFGVITCAAIIIFVYDVNVVLSLVLLILYIGFGSGARASFGGILAFRMRKQINSGSYLASTNAVASVVAGVAPPIAGALIDAFPGIKGYSMLFVVMAGIVLLFIITLVCYSIWFNANRKRAAKNTEK